MGRKTVPFRMGCEMNTFSLSPGINTRITVNRYHRNFRSEDSNELSLLRPLNDTAKKWLEDNVTDPKWLNGALIVDRYHWRPLIEKLIEEGLIEKEYG